MKMNIVGKVKSAVKSVSNSIKYTTAVLTAVGAIGLSAPQYASAQNAKPKYATVQKAMKKLGVIDPNMVGDFPGHYKSLNIYRSDIDLIEGIKQGRYYVFKGESLGKLKDRFMEGRNASRAIFDDTAYIAFPNINPSNEAIKSLMDAKEYYESLAKEDSLLDKSGDHIIEYKEILNGLKDAFKSHAVSFKKLSKLEKKASN